MDEIARKLQRDYISAPSLETAAPYIAALERSFMGYAHAHPLDNMLRKLLVAHLDENGVSAHVYEATYSLLNAITNDAVAADFSNSIDATDGGFYFRTPEHLENLIKKHNLFCPHTDSSSGIACNAMCNPCEIRGCYCPGCIDPLSCDCYYCNELPLAEDETLRDRAEAVEHRFGICKHHHETLAIISNDGEILVDFKL